MLLPYRIVLALQASGWYVRAHCIWHKPSAMPESAQDRPMRDFEPVFLLSKAERYFYDRDGYREPVTGRAYDRGSGVNPKAQRAMKFPAGWQSGPGSHCRIEFNAKRSRQNPSFSSVVRKTVSDRQMRSVWTIPSTPTKEAHFATFPVGLPDRCIRLTSRPGDVVCDPFAGAGTTGLAALRLGRRFVGIDGNASYLRDIARPRIERERWAWDRRERTA